MADPQTKKTVAVNAAKIGGIATFVPVLLSHLPSPYNWAIASIIIACSAINATVPPPAETSKWRIPYKLVEVMALNLGWALNLFGTRVNAPQGSVAPTNTINSKN